MNITKSLLAVFLSMFLSVPAAAALRVVATTPDLADIAKRIGGGRVEVDSLAKGTEDIHAVPVRPSYIPRLRRADAVVRHGLYMEHAFLPALVEASGNGRILLGRAGDIDASVYVTPVAIPASINRAEGEQHPAGNPHYNVDPRNGKLVAKAIAEGFSRIDPEGASLYEKNRAAFESELSAKIEEWKRLAGPLRGVRAVSFHEDMEYFAAFTGLVLSGTVEPKPGIAPSARHLQTLVRKMKDEGTRLILREVQFEDKTARWLADQTGAKVAVVGVMGGAFPDSGTYFGMIEHNLRSVLEAVR